METRQRTFVKAILWNVLGLTTMSFVGLVLTGSVAVGGAMAVVNTVLGFLIYLAYERVWARVRWGIPSSPQGAQGRGRHAFDPDEAAWEAPSAVR